MRITYRSHGGSHDYWQRRWDQIPADDGALSLERYPGRFAESLMREVDGPVLEAGCGAGRVLLHYHRLGRSIVGMDFIAGALAKIKEGQPDVPLVTGNIMALAFPDASFAAVLAFGLYHNLEAGLDEALRETRRVMRHGAPLCASVRADNVQNRIVDWLANRGTGTRGGSRNFHKANYTPAEFRSALERAGFEVVRLEYVENMPFLYKFAPFRHRSHRRFDEHVARGEGYRLSMLGSLLQKALIGLWPGSFCNIIVLTARASGPALNGARVRSGDGQPERAGSYWPIVGSRREADRGDRAFRLLGLVGTRRRGGGLWLGVGLGAHVNHVDARRVADFELAEFLASSFQEARRGSRSPITSSAARASFLVSTSTRHRSM